MAITYQSEIEKIVGTYSDTDALDFYLQNAVRTILNRVRNDVLEPYAPDILVSVLGLNVNDYRIIRAHKDGISTTPVSEVQRGRISDPDSIFYPTDKSPKHYFYNQKLFIVPDDGRATAIAYPTVTYDLTPPVTTLPVYISTAFIYYAAILILLDRAGSSVEVINSLDVSASPAVPISPGTPDFTFTDINGVTIDTTFVDDAGTLTYTTATGETIDLSTITFDELLEYMPVIFSGSYDGTDAALTEEDIALANAHLGVVGAKLQQMQNELADAKTEFDKSVQQFQVNFNKAVENARLAQQVNLEQAQLTTNVEVQNKAKAFEAALSTFQANVQKLITQAQLSQQRALEQAQLTLNTEMQNRFKQLEVQIAEYSSALNRFQLEVSLFSAQAQVLVAEIQSNISIAVQGVEANFKLAEKVKQDLEYILAPYV